MHRWVKVILGILFLCALTGIGVFIGNYESDTYEDKQKYSLIGGSIGAGTGVLVLGIIYWWQTTPHVRSRIFTDDEVSKLLKLSRVQEP